MFKVVRSMCAMCTLCSFTFIVLMVFVWNVALKNRTNEAKIRWYLCGWNRIWLGPLCDSGSVKSDHNRDEMKKYCTKVAPLSAFNSFAMMSMQMRYRKTMNINGVVRPIYNTGYEILNLYVSLRVPLSRAKHKVVVLRIFGVCLAMGINVSDGRWWRVAHVTCPSNAIHLHCNVVTL